MMPYMKYDLQLFAKEGAGGEKTEEPTAKKLRNARNKGQVAKSVDLTAAVSLLVFFGVLKIYIGMLGNRLLENYNNIYGHISDYTRDEFTTQRASSILGDGLVRVVELIAPFLLLSFFTSIIVILVQVKWKISTEPLKPKLSKFNPISGVKRLFSKDKLIMLLTSIAKQVVLVAVVYSVLGDKWGLLMDMYDFSLQQSIDMIGNIVLDIGLRVAILFLVIGVADIFYQKWKFHKDMMMTKQEVKDEYKQAEGDPKVKSRQRQVMRQASQRRMMNAVPEADVVITNPTHLAVALKYDKEQYDAPVVVAKGADYLAERIKDVARSHDVEIVENKPLARMLYHNVELGEQIPPELYQMVAEVLAYVYGLKNRR